MKLHTPDANLNEPLREVFSIMHDLSANLWTHANSGENLRNVRITYLETRGSKYLAYETQCHGTHVLSQILMTNDPDFLENKKIKTNLLKKDSFIFSLFQLQVFGTILKMGKSCCFEILRKLL